MRGTYVPENRRRLLRVKIEWKKNDVWGDVPLRVSHGFVKARGEFLGVLIAASGTLHFRIMKGEYLNRGEQPVIINFLPFWIDVNYVRPKILGREWIEGVNPFEKVGLVLMTQDGRPQYCVVSVPYVAGESK